MASSQYANNVFINCPFDEQYRHLFRALIFAVFDSGFRARRALEVDDASEVRIDKVFRIVAEPKYEIHDISRMELDPDSDFPRFNMPLELGIFPAEKRFGTGKQKLKACIVLDRDAFRYQRFISDISGQDVKAHQNDPLTMIRLTRNWLRDISRRRSIPGGTAIHRRYLAFVAELPKLYEELKLDELDMTFVDYTNLVSIWLKRNG